MKIRTQLLALALTGIVLVLIVGALSVYAKRKVDVALEANTLLTTVLRHHGEADMMHDALRGDVYEAVLAGLRNDPEHIEETQKEFTEHAGNFKGRIDTNSKLPLDGEIRTRLNTLLGPLDAYLRAAEDVINGAADTETTAPKLRGFQTTYEALEKPMAAFSDYLEEQVKQRKEMVDDATRVSEWITIVVTLAGVALMLLLGLAVLRSISGSINSVQRAVDDLGAGSGDLTRRLPAMKGEFGAVSGTLNQFIEGLHQIVSRVRDSAEHIGSSSQQVEQGSRSLSARTEAQAASLEQTASSMEQLTGAVKRTAENAQRANELAQGASRVAERGGETVRGVVGTMNDISESSRKIADIIGVIDSIAFQTNILALNAAVEAARAGEQGRGFAVVASEVRALAQRSAQAAREIREMIQSSVEKVDNGTRFVGDAGKTMDDIVAAVKQVSGIISDISAAGQEQLSGIEQVNRAITDMDASTQQNAAMVEQSTAAATQMAEQARELVTAVARFKLDAMGRAQPLTAASASASKSKAPRTMSAAVLTPMPLEPALQRVTAHNALPPRAATHRAQNAPQKADGEWQEF